MHMPFFHVPYTPIVLSLSPMNCKEDIIDRTTCTPDEIAFIQRLRVARLATADEHGTPYVVPVCYAFDGTQFYIALDEKPKRVAQTRLRRVRNIEARHEASLLIDQ